MKEWRTVTIRGETHAALVEYCVLGGQKLQAVADAAVRDYLGLPARRLLTQGLAPASAPGGAAAASGCLVHEQGPGCAGTRPGSLPAGAAHGGAAHGEMKKGCP